MRNCAALSASSLYCGVLKPSHVKATGQRTREFTGWVCGAGRGWGRHPGGVPTATYGVPNDVDCFYHGSVALEGVLMVYAIGYKSLVACSKSHLQLGDG